jgi:hypothetical protein
MRGLRSPRLVRSPVSGGTRPRSPENGVTDPEARPHRSGEPIEDLCRACKTTRQHTVMVVDGDGRVLRVVCGFCGSQHNYRGGGEEPARAPAARASAEPRREHEGLALVSERERTEPRMSTSEGGDDLELLLRRVIRQELGLTAASPADKWRGGEMVLRPGKPGLQEKKWPLESLFNKIVMIRNRLRTLEQQVNASDLPADAKLRLQSYVTACYGSLTSFNVLFADEDDRFKGSGAEAD